MAMIYWAMMAFSVMQARSHVVIIRDGMMDATEKRNWTIARGLTLAGALYIVVGFLELCPLWQGLVIAVGGWGLGSFVFRKELNRRMGWTRTYVGTTSRYDRFLLSLSIFAKSLKWPDAETFQRETRLHGIDPDNRMMIEAASVFGMALEIGAAATAAFVVA